MPIRTKDSACPTCLLMIGTNVHGSEDLPRGFMPMLFDSPYFSFGLHNPFFVDTALLAQVMNKTVEDKAGHAKGSGICKA